MIVRHQLKTSTTIEKAQLMCLILNMFDQLQALLILNMMAHTMSISINVEGFSAQQYFALGQFIIRLENL